MAGAYGSYFALGRWTAGVMAVSMISNVGLGLACGAMPTIVLRGVPTSESASATSLSTLVRSLGTSIAAAAVGAVLGSMTIRVGGTSLPSAGAFHVSMLIGLGVSVAAALLAMTIPSSRPMSWAEPATAQESVTGAASMAIAVFAVIGSLAVPMQAFALAGFALWAALIALYQAIKTRTADAAIERELQAVYSSCEQTGALLA